MSDVEDWKRKHAVDSDRSVDHPLVVVAIQEFMMNMGIRPGTAAYLGLLNVVMTTAQVARANALGFDPDLLRLTPEEMASVNLEMAAKAVLMGIPVTLEGDDT